MKHIVVMTSATASAGSTTGDSDCAGEEKRCSTCGEFWPADREFFFASKSRCGQLMASCIACTVERRRRPGYSGRNDLDNLPRTRPVASELTKLYVLRAAALAKNK